MSTMPTRELPKNFQPKEAEERWRKFWDDGKYFPADNTSAADPYTIVIPPPNVTGALHLGHGLVQTIQDILIRHHRMAGKNTLWVPGTDHAGIATQHVVVEKLRAEGRRREDLGRDAFVAEVWKWKHEYHARITGQIKQLGCSCDWTREAFTLDEVRAKSVRVAFKHLFDRGLIYRGKYMVNWDPVSLTALADDEVEYEDEVGSLWHLKYPYADGSGRFAIVATTRPETMLGDIAVAVNPSDERYKDAIGVEVELPLTGRRIPIIADDFVKKDFGSGMVKITPAHDPNDFQCAMRQKLPLINIFTDDAKVNDNAPEKYRGMDRYVAREAVLADLKALGLIHKIDKHDHRVGRGYRSKAIVEPRISDQWFVKIAPLAERAVKAVRDGEIRITPKSQENTYFAWMENVRDWCISRQLWWGHRIPVWYKKGNPAEMICHDGEGVPPQVAAEPDGWVQDNDVLDTWFSSALWPFSTMGWPDKTKDLATYFPTSVLVTGHDILFFWVARMIMMSYELTGQPPFRDVFLHGLIFGKTYYRRRGGDMEMVSPKERIELGLEDMETLPAGIEAKWEKMSKSKGNVIDPLEMFDRFGVDATRIALAAYSGQGRTIEIDRQRISGYAKFINKLWNASRLVLMATEDVTPEVFRGGVPTGNSAAAKPEGDHFLDRIARERGLERVSLQDIQVDPALVSRVPLSVVRELIVFPISASESGILFAIADPLDLALVPELERLIGEPVQTVIAAEDEIRRFISRFYEGDEFKDSGLQREDRWILTRLGETVAQATGSLREYRFDEYIATIYRFLWDDYCDWYLELVKGRIYGRDVAVGSPSNITAKVSALTVLEQVLRLLHPVIPHATEEIWQLLRERLAGVAVGEAAPAATLRAGSLAFLDAFGAPSLAIAKWPEAPAFSEPKAVEEIAFLQAVINGMRNIRGEMGIPPEVRVDALAQHPDAAIRALLESASAQIGVLTQAKSIAVAAEHPPAPFASTFVSGDLKVQVLLPAELLAQEVTRLEKELAKLQKGFDATNGKLQNEKFSANAPADVVAKEREKLAKYEADMVAIREKLASLKG